MRNAIVVAAFAASAFAAPHNHKHKRDEVIVTDYDIVTAVDVVTVTAGSPAPEATTTAAPASSSSSSRKHHWHWSSWNWSSQQTSTTEAAAPTTVVTSTYVAPSPSSYEAPSSTEAPATTAAPSTTEAPSSVWTSKAPSTTQKPSSTQAAATTAANDGSYSAVAVAHHNLHRSNHSAPAIEWDAGLASIAQSIADTCVYEHNTTAGGGGYGQNIAAGVQPNNISAIITELFYNGEVNWYDGLYGQENPDMTNFEHWGHFSQIVWYDTTHVGCATTDCTSQGLGNVGSDVAPYFTVCNYKSPGNYGGEYGDNVKAPKGDATAYWNTGSEVSS